jgi:hypothetical protein
VQTVPPVQEDVPDVQAVPVVQVFPANTDPVPQLLEAVQFPTAHFVPLTQEFALQAEFAAQPPPVHV